MPSLADLSVQSIFFFFMIFTIFNSLLLLMIWISNKKYKTLEYLMYANIFQTVAIALIFIDGMIGSFTLVPFSNLFGLLQIAFWMFAFMYNDDVKFNNRHFYLFVVVGFIYSIVTFYGIQNVGLLRAGVSFMMFLTEVLAIYYIVKSKKENFQVKNYLIVVFIGFIALYHLFRAVYRSLVLLEISNIFETDTSVTMFVLISLVLNIIVNLLLVALNFQEAIDKVEASFENDPLTKVLTRSSFLKLFDSHLSKKENEHCHFALCMIDIDDFKMVNDQFGHLIGDEVLHDFAQTIKRSIREDDLFARYGGEEFLLVYQCVDEHITYTLANRLREKIEKAVLSSKKVHLTCSLGVVYIEGTEGIDSLSLIEEADKNLYKAKLTGKNKVVTTSFK